MKELDKEKYAFAAISNRTLEGLENGIMFIVNQTGCTKEEALQIITDNVRKRICNDRVIS